MPSLPFAQNIRALRLRRQLSQRELAEKAGVTTKFLSVLERGGAVNPTLLTLTAIASALGVTIAALLNEAPVKEPKRKPLRRAQKRLVEIAEKLDSQRATALATVGKYMLFKTEISKKGDSNE